MVRVKYAAINHDFSWTPNMTPHKSKTMAVEPKAFEDKGTVTFSGNYTNHSVNTEFSSSDNSIGEVESTLLKPDMLTMGAISAKTAISDEKLAKSASDTARPGCSYIEEFSHVTETSAFYRFAHKTGTTSALAKEMHKAKKDKGSEQYGQNIAAFDGITARSKRQSALVSTPRDDNHKRASERVHKLRKKLNPVRDYRLMDTVHYLAQGEFAPRDDGIKLTPSREAVLSDIIWEDICRTHWPNTRLSPATAPPERSSTRRELQRLIDSLLRERISHVERRKRRHYRSVKLTNRIASSRTVGKTGDIIVATHKNNERLSTGSDHDTRKTLPSYKGNRSHDNFNSNRKKCYYALDCSPGPSHIIKEIVDTSADKCRCSCTRTSEIVNTDTINDSTVLREEQEVNGVEKNNRLYSKKARLLFTKDSSRRKVGVEILPAIVIRTSSAMKQCKNFNMLYQRILNLNRSADVSLPVEIPTSAEIKHKQNINSEWKSNGLNISSSEDDSD